MVYPDLNVLPGKIPLALEKAQIANRTSCHTASRIFSLWPPHPEIHGALRTAPLLLSVRPCIGHDWTRTRCLIGAIMARNIAASPSSMGRKRRGQYVYSAPNTLRS